ncbi:hypothetical protein B0H21DRAFT_737305 [Amylocystis lapponica]|nr:hypothetical protein B0H21DRAFT_737305 [Amylocystis lapponica]
MSGKAPPRAPRALLNSLAASSSSATASTASPSPSTSATKIGGTPPTGPRILTNGHYGSAQTSLRGGRGKPFVNGHASIPTGPAAATPPTGPRATQKGKQVENAWNHPASPSTSQTQVNGGGVSRSSQGLVNGEAVAATTQGRAASISTRTAIFTTIE